MILVVKIYSAPALSLLPDVGCISMALSPSSVYSRMLFSVASAKPPSMRKSPVKVSVREKVSHISPSSGKNCVMLALW